MPHNISDLAKHAMNSTAEGITIADITLPDEQLVYINQGFLNLSGYSHDEIIHKNCRFLQGENTSKSTTKKIRETIQQKKHGCFELVNYRKNGELFWNRLTLSPIPEKDQSVRYYVGVQCDITMYKTTAEHLMELSRKLMNI